MARLLYLVHRIPYPPNKGDKIRAYNILKALGEDHDIVLGCFVDDPDDAQYIAHLEELCAEVYCVTIDPRVQKLKSLSGLVTRTPLSTAYYQSPSVQDWVDEHIGAGVDGVILFSSAMARFMRWDRLSDTPVWMDFVDLDSDKWRQYAAAKTGLDRFVYSREARRLQHFESQVAARAAHSSFVTSQDAELFLSQNRHLRDAVHVVPNGVDLAYFDAEADFEALDFGPDNEVIFTGVMDYWANVDAVLWFAKDILPKVRAKIPTAHFTIVGAKPTKAVRDLQRSTGISITGFVRDVRPYISRANVSVAPLRVARGVQNKVLEAMAMEKAVVTTPAGFEGIAATPGSDILVEGTAESFAAAVVSLLQDPAKRKALGQKARRTMESAYQWDKALSPIASFANSLGQDRLAQKSADAVSVPRPSLQALHKP